MEAKITKNKIFILKSFPIPPTVNIAYASNKQGRRFKTKVMKSFETNVFFWSLKNKRLLDNVSKYFKEKIFLNYWINVSMFVHIESDRIFTKSGKLKKIDVSNRIKATHDMLSEAIGIDDKFFSVGRVEFIISNKNEIDLILKADKIKKKEDLNFEDESDNAKIF